MKRRSVPVRIVVMVLALLVAFPAASFAWGPATHAYIAQRLNSKPLLYTYNQMYGAVVPDINLLFPDPFNPQQPQFLATHYGFGTLWNNAATGTLEKPFAFGFVSHNEQWGADRSAHEHSFLYGNDGYVIIKGQQLCTLLRAQLASLGMGDAGDLVTDASCHFMVEYGIDLLMKLKDPAIGQKLATAARNRPSSVPELLAVTYDSEFVGREALYQEGIAIYGDLLNLPNVQAIPALANWLTQLGSQLGVVPTNDPRIPKLIELALADSMLVCAPDFGLEVDFTIWSVRYNLWSHHIYY